MIFTVGTASEFRIFFFFFGNISIGYILYIHILNFFFLVLPLFLFNANLNNWSEDEMQLGI